MEMSEKAKKSSDRSSENGENDVEMRGRDDELVGNINPNQRNWRGIGIALLVILVVCAIVITAVILVTPNEQDVNPGAKFEIDDMFNSDFEPRHFTAHWLPDKEEFIFKNSQQNVVRYDAIRNASFLIMDNSSFLELETSSYKVSPDLKYVILAYNERSCGLRYNYKANFEMHGTKSAVVYRHSVIAQYKIKTRQKKKLDLDNGNQLQYAGWGPKDNAMVYVKGNNIYYKPSVSAAAQQLTKNGAANEIFNGIPNWIYEEEILGTDHALWWSPMGTYLCYAVFNDSLVPRYSYPIYGQAKDVYGHINQISYTKPGYPNPTFQLKIVHFGTKREVTLQPPKQFRNKEHLFTSVSWRDDAHLIVIWSNRVQNHSIITICQAADGVCVDSMQEKGHGGWVFISDPPIFTADGSKYFMVLSQKYDSSSGYYRRVTMVTIPPDNSEGDRTYLTSGKTEVHSIVSQSDSKKLVYYLSNGGNTTRMHLYSVSYDESSSGYKRVRCLSCNVSQSCQYVSASFSNSARYYILGCQGPGVPYYILINIDSSPNDVKYTMLESNSLLKSKLEKKAIPKKVYFTVDVDGVELTGYHYQPYDLKKEQILKYPVLITTYAGPGSLEVTERFSIGWLAYLASSHNIICGGIDGHGSRGRGDKFKMSIYRKLGQLEVHDQIHATKNYFDKLPYAESTKKAIWGWSYGGYVSLLALADLAKVFKCAIAVAPVTDWRYYDSIYTERYMGYPNPMDNESGYKAANVSTKAKDFPQDSLLLIHGTGDDNVHFQHTAQLIHFLTEAGIKFSSQIYTDKQHGLNGDATRRHLYTTMENFLERCLGLESFRKQRDDPYVSNKQERMDSQ